MADHKAYQENARYQRPALVSSPEIAPAHAHLRPEKAFFPEFIQEFGQPRPGRNGIVKSILNSGHFSLVVISHLIKCFAFFPCGALQPFFNNFIANASNAQIDFCPPDHTRCFEPACKTRARQAQD